MRPELAAAQDDVAEVDSESKEIEADESDPKAPPDDSKEDQPGAQDEGEAQQKDASYRDRAHQDTVQGRVFLGARADRHIVPRTSAPVVVLTADDLQGWHGPSLIRPAMLRGLGADRTLVLVNGKRRHQMAEINLNEEVGRGTSGTDLNAIPIAAIERIEILRDSATALYGPNAIGGVVNIVLKERMGLEVEATVGNYYEHDGNALLGLDLASARANGGIPLGDKGFVNLTLELRDRGETNRAGIATIESSVDGRALGSSWWTDDPSCPTDPFDPSVRPPCKPVRRLRQGNADGQDYYLFYNGGYELTDVVSLYSFGGLSRRIGNTPAGLFLGVGSSRVPAELYTDGFQPALVTTIDDLSVTVGARFALGDPWELDVSGTWGRSKFNYDVENSANTSWYYEIDPATGDIYGTTPRSANAGQLINTETTVNLDLTGELEVLEKHPLKVGVGAEVRIDNYEIVEGEFVSYAYGRSNIVDPNNPIFNESSFPLRSPVVGGIQGFPGFAPEAAVDGTRAAWGSYVDAEQNLTDWWLVGAAGRFETVEFIGNSVVGGLRSRVDVTDFLSLRGSASTGSRPPDVQKIYFSQKITAILPSGLTETITAGDANPLRSEFGMGQLKPEKSVSVGGGIVVAPKLSGPTRSLTLTADVYQVKINDRILLSESVTGQIPTVPVGQVDTPGRQQFRQLLDDQALGAAQFFVNLADTVTRGIDVTGNWGVGFGDLGMNLGGAFHYSETRIEGSHPDSSLVTEADLFGPILQNRLQKGQPRYTASLFQVTSYDPLTFRVALNYYGSVTGKAYMALDDEKVWGGKWLTDASVSYAPIPKLVLTVGGNNLFDVYPDKWGEVGREYPEIGYTYGLETLPFGVNGGFYYLSASYTL